MGVKSLHNHLNGNATLTIILFESNFRITQRERVRMRLLEEPPLFYKPVCQRSVRLHSSDIVAVRPDYG